MTTPNWHLTLWQELTNETWFAHQVTEDQPAWILPDGAVQCAGARPHAALGMLVRPVRPVEPGTLGAAIVPRQGMVAINGVAASAGSHHLRHGDVLVVADKRFCVSKEPAALGATDDSGLLLQLANSASSIARGSPPPKTGLQHLLAVVRKPEANMVPRQRSVSL